MTGILQHSTQWLRQRCLVACLALLITGPAAAQVNPQLLDNRPRLVVVIVVDQLRADYLTQLRHRFLPAKDPKGRLGGFRYLTDLGAYYPTARYEVLYSKTGPNHATLATGSYPYRHGIADNWYFDVGKHRMTYCAYDPKYSPIAASAKAQKRGTAPTQLRGPTLGDALKNVGAKQTRVVSISLKDRAAILMGGARADAAVWFDYRVFRWTSSNYYFRDGKLPSWVDQQNRSIEAAKGKEFVWKLKPEGQAPALERSLKVGTPHSLASPYGDVITANATLSAMDYYKLGHDKHPDILWVSFSSLDYLGHSQGPRTAGIKGVVVALDRTLSRLFNTMKAKLPNGLKDTVFVLTGDHGIPPDPNYLMKHRIPAGYVDVRPLAARVEKALSKQLGPSSPHAWIAKTRRLGFVLNRKALKKRSVPLHRAAKLIRQELLGMKNVAHILLGSDLAKGHFPPGKWGIQARNSFDRDRSPDVLIVPRPYFMPPGEPLSHSSGYTYDVSIPLVMKGRYVRRAVLAHQPHITSVAPTLSWMLGIVPPALSEGRLLNEVFSPPPPRKKPRR